MKNVIMDLGFEFLDDNLSGKLELNKSYKKG